tara:strand:+ start:1202 stop:2836 length:1635 start_codon:yes stop_codon:yes gene_type:complete
MSNRIKIKRNSSADFDSSSLPSSLHYGELAFQNYQKKLFIGRCTADNQADSGATTIHLPLLSDLTDGNGLTKTVAGGDTDNSVTLALDLNELGTESSIAQPDFIAMVDADDNGSQKITFSNLEDTIFGNVSSDITIAAGGAATIGADKVHGTMLNTDAADTSTIELSSDTLSVLKVPNALTAGTGITAGGTFDGAAARTISITPAQTAITSILNTSLKMGREEDSEYIDFTTDGETRLAAGGVVMVKAIDATQDIVEIAPGSTDVDFKVYDDAGSSAFEVIADGGAVNVAGVLTTGSISTTNYIGTNVVANTYKYNNSGSAGNTAFTIGASGGVNFNATMTQSANSKISVDSTSGAILRLYSARTDVGITNVLGRIDFAAENESSGSDAVALAASIEAKAAADFTATANKTDLIFYVGESGTAAEAMKIGWDKKVTIQGDLQVDGTTTTVNSTTVTVDDPIFTLGGEGNAGSDDDKDRGIEFKYHTGSAAKVGFFGFDDTDSKFKFIPDATNSSEVFSGSVGSAEFNDVEAATITSATIDCGTY